MESSGFINTAAVRFRKSDSQPSIRYGTHTNTCSVKMSASEDSQFKCELFGLAQSNFSSRVRHFIYEHQLEQHVKLSAIGDRTTESYKRDAHPYKKFPVLKILDHDSSSDSDVFLFETQVIVDYLLDRFVKNSKDESDPLYQAKIGMYVRLHDTYISNHQGRLYRACTPEELQKGLDSIEEGLDILEDKLLRDAFRKNPQSALIVNPAAGINSELSSADFAWFCTFIYYEYIIPRWFGRSVLDPTSRPLLNLWYNWMKKKPSSMKVHSEMWAALEEWDKSGRWTKLGHTPLAPARSI